MNHLHESGADTPPTPSTGNARLAAASPEAGHSRPEGPDTNPDPGPFQPDLTFLYPAPRTSNPPAALRAGRGSRAA